MYYFKDHLNFTNNLQDNLYILRQRQLKEEMKSWSPSSGGPAIPESGAGNNELKDRMRNIKQSGDRQQSKEYLEMEAELNRRMGGGSPAQAAPSQASSSQVAPSQASSSQSSSTSSRSTGTQEWYDPDRQGSRQTVVSNNNSQTSQNQRGVDITQQSPDRIAAMNDPSRGGQSGRFGNPNAGRGPTTTAQPVSGGSPSSAGGGNARPTATPSATPVSVAPPSSSPRAGGKPMEIRDMDGNPVSITPPPAPSQQAANTFGPPAPSQQDANTFGPPAPVNRTPTAAPQREMDKWGQGSMPNNSGGMQNADQTPVSVTPPSSPPTNTSSPTTYRGFDRGDGLPQSEATPQSSPSTASNPILDQLRKTWKDLGTPRYSPKPESASPGVDATEPQSFGTSGTNNAPGQPYVVPGSQDWNNMSHDEQRDMAARAIINNETHKFTGGRRSDVKDIDQVSQPRFSEDSGEGGPSAADINQRSRIANAVIDKTNKEAQDQESSKFNISAGVAENDPNYIYSRKGFAQSLYSPEESKPAEDTRPTSGRKSIYPGSFEDILDRMQNNDRSKKMSSILKQGQARRNFNRRAK